ncbi:hypothetical protein, partial [Streptomyces mangrovisoli]|uniref:hypothetical protein n=1 Tax=Streptomyces mangrovisoli TaxID=1428628 RepID=UPI0011601AE5
MTMALAHHRSGQDRAIGQDSRTGDEPRADQGTTDIHGRVAHLREIRAQALAGPGAKATEAQH